MVTVGRGRLVSRWRAAGLARGGRPRMALSDARTGRCASPSDMRARLWTLVLALLLVGSANADQVLGIGLDELRSGVIPAEELAHVYVLELPAGVPHLTVLVDAGGDDADMAVYYGPEREEVYYDITIDPYPVYSTPNPRAGRYEIHVMNLLWQDLAYVLEVSSSAGTAPRTRTGAPPSVLEPYLLRIGLDEQRSGELAADEIEHVYLLDVPAGVPRLTIALDAFGQDIDMAVWDADGDVLLYEDISADPYPRFTLEWPPGGRLEIQVLNLVGVDMPYVLQVTTGAVDAVAPPPVPAPAPRPVPAPPAPPTATAPPVDEVETLLLVDARLVQPSASVTVRFEGLPDAPQNWIGLFAVGTGDRQHLRWQYTGSGTSGQLVFSAPSEPGRYEFRVFERNGYTLLATSPAFEVRAAAPPPPATGPRVWLPTRVVAPGSTFAVAFAGTPGNATDWIGLHRLDADDRQHLSWRYTDGVASGSLSFTAPSEPGTYQARLFAQNGYTRLAESEPFEVRAGGVSPPPEAAVDAVTLHVDPLAVAPSGSVTVAFAGTPGNDNDWIGLYRLGADDRQYLHLDYTRGVVSGRLAFTAPSEPGRYEFRLFAFGGWTLLATSPAFEVR